MPASNQIPRDDKNLEGLRRFCSRLIRDISDYATDPHLYFSQRFSGDVERAESLNDALVIFSRLANWVATLGIRVDRLDAGLADDRLPTYTLMSSERDRTVAVILCSGRLDEAECEIVRRWSAGRPPDCDSELADGLVAAYEKRR